MAENKAQALMEEFKRAMTEVIGIDAAYVDVYGEDSGATEEEKEKYKGMHYVLTSGDRGAAGFGNITAINTENGRLLIDIDGKQIDSANDLMETLPHDAQLREVIADHANIDLYANYRDQCQSYAEKVSNKDKNGNRLCCLQFEHSEESSEKICEIYAMMQKRGIDLSRCDFQLSDNKEASAYIILPDVYSKGQLNDGSLMEFKNFLMDLATDPRYADFQILNKDDTSYERNKVQSMEKAIENFLDPENNPRGLLAEINKKEILDIVDMAGNTVALNGADGIDRYIDSTLKFLNSHHPLEEVWKNEKVVPFLKECAEQVTAANPKINRDSLLHFFASVDIKNIEATTALRMLQASFQITDKEIEEAQMKYFRRGGYDKWKEDRKAAIEFALEDEDYLKFAVDAVMQDEAHGEVLDAELSGILQELNADESWKVLGKSYLSIEKDKPYLKNIEKVYEFDTSCADMREALKEKLRDPKLLVHAQSYEEQQAGKQAITMLETIINAETEQINKAGHARDSKFKPLEPFKKLDPPNIDVYLAKAAALYEKENDMGMTNMRFEEKFAKVIQNARTLQNTQSQEYRLEERLLHFTQMMADRDATKVFFDKVDKSFQEALCKTPKLMTKSIDVALDLAKKLYEGVVPAPIQAGLAPASGAVDKGVEKAQEIMDKVADKFTEGLKLSCKKAQEDKFRCKVNDVIKNSLISLTNHAAHLALKITSHDQTRVPVHGTESEIAQARENIRAIQAEHNSIDAGTAQAVQASLSKVVSWSKTVASGLAEAAKTAAKTVVGVTKEAVKAVAKTVSEIHKDGSER